jgi:multicomponent Na+:H+ antiporter subunit D
MSTHFPALIIVVPLISAFIIALAGWVNRKYCLPYAIAGLGIALLTAVGLLFRVMANGPVDYYLAGWQPPVGIAYRVDHLNGLVLVVVAAVALINLIATRKSVEAEFADRIGPFYALYVLFVTGLSGIVVTGDAFNLFVLLEITALTGYALIGIGKGHAALASLNYIFMGTIGASFYLLGIGYLYLVTGSLNMADIASLLPQIADSRVVTAAFIICMTGLFMKMALFPLHAWLPNAYAYAPSPAASLIAPLTTKVMIYVMIRIVLTVFTPDFAFDRMQVSGTVVWLAIIAIVMGSIMALGQKSLKRMLTYIVIAEVGYMVGGFWLGNRTAVAGSILHIVNDAAMTLCVFLAAGSLQFRLHNDRFESLRGAFARMPVTMGALAVGGLSIIGVPPTCGFFSKWYLISGGIAAGHWAYVIALLFSSLVNAVLFFRIFEIAYFEPFTDHHGGHGAQAAVIREAPLSMVTMLVLVAASLLVLGIYSGDIVTKVIDMAIPQGIV